MFLQRGIGIAHTEVEISGVSGVFFRGGGQRVFSTLLSKKIAQLCCLFSGVTILFHFGEARRGSDLKRGAPNGGSIPHPHRLISYGGKRGRGGGKGSKWA